MFNKIALFVLSLGIVLSGCQSTVYDQTEGNVADTKVRINEARQKSDHSGKPDPTVVIKDGSYVDTTPISLMKQPSWLKNRIVLRGDKLPFSFYSRTIVGGAQRNVLTHYQVGLNDNEMVTMNYAGSVKGALDLLAAKTGYVYSIQGNNIYWQAFITKTFDVAFMPGTSDYMMGKAGSSGGSISAPAGGGAAGGVVTSAAIEDSASEQYSTLKGTLSVWKDLKDTIQQLLSTDGKVIVSESTTTVTVRDRPTNVALVEKYIANLNENLSRQVLVKVQVLTVSLNTAFNFGIQWDAVKKMLGASLKLNANYGTPVSITPLTGGALPQVGFQRDTTEETGVTALINALTQQGKVSLVTEPRVICLNNQVSAIRILNQEGYLASVQNTTVAGSVGVGSTVTSQLTPGTLITGLTLYILPKILGDKVYLQVNADLSNKISIQTISSQTGGSPPTTGTVPAGSIIQVPSLTQKQFNQRSVIDSGDTLILSGFRQVRNETGAMQLFDLQALGGKGSTQNNDETIVLITPIILHGYV